MKTTLSRLFVYMATGLVMALLNGVHVQAAGRPLVQQFLVGKGIHHMQNGAGTPELGTNKPYQFMANLEPTAPPILIRHVYLMLSTGGGFEIATNGFPLHWEYQYSFSTKAFLDSYVPAGDYTFTILTWAAELFFPTLTLPDDAYPSIPHILNWGALQTVDTTIDLLVTWDPVAGGTTNDFVQFSFKDDMGHSHSTGDHPGYPGSLNGTHTSIVIPAGTLAGGAHYSGSLFFSRGTYDTNAMPGAVGIAAYFRETSFSFSTAAAPASGRFRFAQPSYSVNEDGPGVVLTVLRGGSTSGDASVVVTTHSGIALPGFDYSYFSNRIEFADGVASMDVPIIKIVDHPTLDGNKTFFAMLTAPSEGADLGTPAVAVITILDSEVPGAGTLGFSAPMYTVSEALTNVAVTVNRTDGSSGDVSIAYTTISGSAEAGDDFSSSEGVLIFSNGVTSRTINIPILPDNLDETNETFYVALFNPNGGAALGAQATATVVIQNDDTGGVLSFAAPAYSVNESETNFPVIIRRSSGAADGVSVELVITGGTATLGEDYDHDGGDTVTLHFGAGQMAITNLFAIHDDGTAEGDETILLSLRNPGGGARLSGVTNSLVRIVDDGVTLQFFAASYTNKETAGAAVIFVERSGPLNVPASVHVRTSGGSGRPNVDYVPTNVVVHFAPGATKKPVVIRLINDLLVEGPETIGLVLEDPSENAYVGPRGESSLVILSDDRGGAIEFGTSTLNVLESRPFLSVVIIRTGGLASNVTVRLATTAMSAHDGEDYTGTNMILTFAARERVKKIRIPILQDTLAEGLETFALNLSNPTGGATLGGRSGRIAVILDDDVGGVISFARPEIVVSENGANAVVIVNRAGGAASEVKVRLATADGAATDSDYVRFDEVLTFAAGERSKTNLIRIQDNEIAGGAIPKTILLTLREFRGGGRPGLSNAVIRIVDDESSVSFTNNTVSATEGRVLAVAVARAGALNTQVTVDYMTMDDTASAGTNYRGTNGTLAFPPHVAVRFITIPILNGALAEPGETFRVVLKNPQGGVQLGLNTDLVVSILARPGVR